MGFYLDKSVASYLVKAQLCSDAGKGMVHNRQSTFATKAEKAGYTKKDFFIKKAINKILLSRKNGIDPGFHFYVVTWEDDIDVFADTIIYFNFKDEAGNRRQISFHSPYGDYKKFAGSHHVTRWDNDRGGSREAADYLFAYYQIKILGRKEYVSLYNYE